jgi:hypothetical protein
MDELKNELNELKKEGRKGKKLEPTEETVYIIIQVMESCAA